jgi:hypothetical protein
MTPESRTKLRNALAEAAQVDAALAERLAGPLRELAQS